METRSSFLLANCKGNLIFYSVSIKQKFVSHTFSCSSESPEWLDDQVGGQFYGYVTGTANLSCEAEAEPAPQFRWLDAENRAVEAGTIINDAYKVTITCRIGKPAGKASSQIQSIQVKFDFNLCIIG